MKPGITYFRLVVFLVTAVVLCVVALNVASMSYPPLDECAAKGIDAIKLNEGTCREGDSTLVVVDRHSTLRLATLEVKLLAVHYGKVAAKEVPGGAGDRLITFDLSVRDRIDTSASVGKGQFVLNAGKACAEDVGFEEGDEPRSFLAQGREIPAFRTMKGTVTFRVPAVVARAVRKGGNLDVVNLGSSVPVLEPEAVFSEPEFGVIRVYH